MIRRLWKLRPSRRRVVTVGQCAVLLTCGWLLARESLGEPVRSRTALVLLMVVAWIAGRMWEVTRPGGITDLQRELETLEPSQVVVTLDVDGYGPGELATAVADGALVLSRRSS